LSLVVLCALSFVRRLSPAVGEFVLLL
jgi:hypothetical protein